MAKDFTKKEIKAYLANTSRCPRCAEDTIKLEEPFTEVIVTYSFMRFIN